MMQRLFSNRKRPVHWGAFPLERLKRQASAAVPPQALSERTLDLTSTDDPNSLVGALLPYLALLDRMRHGDKAPEQAPIPDDLKDRSEHLKAACYFLDANMVGVAEIEVSDWLSEPLKSAELVSDREAEYGVGAADNPMAQTSVQEGQIARGAAPETGSATRSHTHALVIVHEHPRKPEEAEPGTGWILDMQQQRAALRGAEVGAVMCHYFRMLGFDATLHTNTARDISIAALLVSSGLGEAGDAGQVNVPYLGEDYSAIAITTNLSLAPDQPLERGEASKAGGLGWWTGLGGTRAGFLGKPFSRRPYHLGPYPMEKVKRRETPTTFIDTPRVPRVPKRHDMFIRGAIGDLGEKAQKELEGFRMITKSPFGHAMVPVLGAMVPLQYGDVAPVKAEGYDDPKKNSQLVKSALHYLGADMVGICEIPDYAWYSHDVDGSEIQPYHRYAICILIDQGHETMEGASGDDWISGAQSMRAYMRAQLVGGVLGDHLRRLGFSARGHSVMDQDVLHIPLNLLAGLGELPRIGEMVLNPFVGPRFKSGILTTDLPLEADNPIDFGMQDFCNQCLKCARECPCSAIPAGDKIMFNGYEIWKPDVEKCSRYRITNAAGSMCGRCMKTCPYNLEGIMKERPFLWSAMNLPWTRKWLARLDDRLGRGAINSRKKWWWDLDTDDNGRVIPAKRTNARGLTFKEIKPSNDKLACYPSESVPEPIIVEPSPLDRKAGIIAYERAPSVDAYKQAMGPGVPSAKSS